MSNVAQMAMLKPYQQIIGMGEAAVPLLLEELRATRTSGFGRGGYSQENPVPPEAAGKVRAMAEEWVAWGKRQGYMAA